MFFPAQSYKQFRLYQKLKELRDELMHERGVSAMGGAPSSPGAIRALRLNIARILTVQKEEEEI